MLIVLYLAVLVTALYYVSKLLLPEMAKPSPIKAVRRDLPEITRSAGPDNRIEKLEKLLAEKNMNIDSLQAEVKAFHTQALAFHKFKTLLEEDIRRLREQNRIFRSELGLPAAQPKENSIT